MIEPVSITCGILYAGLGKVLWDGAAKVGDQALGGLIGNRTDAAAVAIGRVLHGRLLARRGLSENHDIARALRRAQIVATEFVIETYAKGAGPNPPVAFLAGVRAGLKTAHKDVAAFQWDDDVEAAMFASYQQAFREPQDADDPDLVRGHLSEQTTLVAWAEVESWADGAHAPDRLKQRFFGQASQIIGFHDAWCGEVVEAMKTDERFRTIFVADKLVEIGDIVIDGRAVLDRLEDATEGVREQLGEMERWLAGQFDEQRGLHQETHEMLRRIEDSMRAQGRTLAPDEREAVETTLEEVAASTGDDLQQARAGLSDEDPIALIDGLEAAASRDAASRLRQAGAIAYAVDVERALRIYGKVAALEPEDHWTHVLLGRLHVVAGDLTAAASAAKAALESAEDERDRMVAMGALGDLAALEGDLPGARKAYEGALKIACGLSERDPKNTALLHDLSVSYERLGVAAVAEGDLLGARRAYEASLAIVQDLTAADPENPEWLRALSVDYNKIGDVAVQEGDLPGARRAYEDGLAIRRNLTALDPNDSGRLRDLSLSYNKSGDLAVKEGDLSAARKAYQDGLTIRKDLTARDPKNTGWLLDLSNSYGRLGDVAGAEGDLSGARTAYEDALAIQKDLTTRDPKNSGWLRGLSVSYERLGDLADAESDQPAAVAHYLESLPLAERLAALDPSNALWAKDLEITRRRLAELEAKAG